MGQAGVALGIALKSRNKETKAIAYGATVSAFFGITEPALYGLITGIMGGKLYSLGTGLLGIPSLVNPETGFNIGFYGTILGSIITLILATLLTYKFGFSKETDLKLQGR